MNIKELKEDFINIPHTAAISAEGDLFKIGDIVNHEGSDRKNGIISKFTINTETNDIIAHTQHGRGRISFMYHTNEK